jgi:hypothetical protein
MQQVQFVVIMTKRSRYRTIPVAAEIQDSGCNAYLSQFQCRIIRAELPTGDSSFGRAIKLTPIIFAPDQIGSQSERRLEAVRTIPLNKSVAGKGHREAQQRANSTSKLSGSFTFTASRFSVAYTED